MRHYLKIITFIAFCIGFTHSAVLNYNESFNRVRVVPPAKSQQVTCHTRVDLVEGLVDNSESECPIEDIMVFNKNNMWIGSLGSVSEYSHRRYEDYDDDRYKGKGHSIKIEYVFNAEDANEDNEWLVSCPTGMFKYIEGDFYRCKKPYICDSDMYAYDSLNCSYLPENAQRNTTIGWHCKPGYVMNTGYMSSYNECVEKTTCSPDERYDEFNNSCLSLPANAKWKGNTSEWECKPGYLLSDDECIEKAVCSPDERYDESTNTCYGLPSNAHWEGTSTVWSCNRNYVLTNGNTCDERAQCDSASRYNSAFNRCETLPAFAHWSDNDPESIAWQCNDEYVEINNNCERKANCLPSQLYQESSNSCEDPYPHSHWTGWHDDYECDNGYVDIGYGRCEEKKKCAHYNEADNTCYTKPEHAYWLSDRGDQWECEDGYHHKSGESICFKCPKDMQFDKYTEECISKPEHAIWVGDAIWDCEDGYVEINGKCEEKVTCWFSRYNETYNTCVRKPAHSHWSDDHSTYFECDNGYYNHYNECIAITSGETGNNNNTTIDYKNYIHLYQSISFILGGTSAKDNAGISTNIVNTAFEYGFGIKFGTDFFNIRPMAIVGVLFNSFDYSDTSDFISLDENVYSLAFITGVGFGIDLWRFTFEYYYLYTTRETLSTIYFNTTLPQYKFGFRINEHWDINMTVINNLIKETKLLADYSNTIYNIGVTYAF